VSQRVEQRRYARAPVHSPASFSIKGSTDKLEGSCRDISIGGMFFETLSPAPFGTELTVYVLLPGGGATSSLPGVVRWVDGAGMGVQFGLLGAVETHLITEISRKYGT
jgi:type IV pilus assembly protein PilZ